MKKSKILFLILAGAFFLTMLYLGYDISSRTTSPGSKSQLKERILDSDFEEVDTTGTSQDSTALVD